MDDKYAYLRSIDWDDIKESAVEGNFECMKLLLERGVKIEERNILLLWTSTLGHLECMKLVVKYGVSPSALADALQNTVANGNLEGMKLLLEWGAQISNSF